MSLLATVQHRATSAGLNLFGLVDAERFDACQPRDLRTAALAPGCGTVVVVGSAGRAVWQSFVAAGGVHGPLGVDGFASQAVHEVAALLQQGGCGSTVVEAGPLARLNFARLGEAAGFGTVSPVTGLLLHPEYGPWLRVRAALLVPGRPFGAVADASITDRFQPCCTCAKPCITACPANAYDGQGRQDLGRCASHRHAGNCATGCTTRSACPLGSAHRDAAEESAHRHGHPLTALRRAFGLGVWRFVPSFLRR